MAKQNRANKPAKEVPKRFTTVSVSTRVRNKLNQAKYLRDKLETEVHGVTPTPTPIAVQSYLGGCLSASRSIVQTVLATIPTAQADYQRWVRKLNKNDEQFWKDMRDERDADVHESLTTLHQNVSIGGGAPNPTVEYRMQLTETVEVVSACRRFIDLIEELMKQLRV
jgi:hypothetical protein